MKNYLLLSIFFISLILGSCNPEKKAIDYALLAHKGDWSHDYALGSPSWDTFERLSGNPVCRGRKGMEWPVNGFLYSDPVSKNWYLYIGEYREFYKSDQDPTTTDFKCIIYKSSDKGRSWNKCGDLFPPSMQCYDSVRIQAPDVMVTYSEGKYHMVFDWLAEAGWQRTDLSGIGYAVSDKPEGPFVVSKRPAKFNTQYKQKPLLRKYWRMYAPMIVKREKDWALLYMMDTTPTSSWALAVSTASNPEGPYSESKIILNVERKTNYEPLQEYFPAFLHDGYAYFPATSVSINRNYQSVHRVKVEDLTNPDKYELFSGGSFWHSENVENEYSGIWGQTFTGFVDENDSVYVMFPSKDPHDYGTINLAKASWKNFNRARGFNLTANEGNTFSYLKRWLDIKDIDLKFKLDGTMHLVWDFHSPIDILNSWGKFSLIQDNADYKEIELNRTGWKIYEYENGKNIIRIDSGKVNLLNTDDNRLQLIMENGKATFVLNGEKRWSGILSSKPGIVGVSLMPHSFLFANSFVVNGAQKQGSVIYGYYQALVNTGNYDNDWTFKKDSMFLFGRGAVSKKDSSFAKWNFDGKGFELYSPKGPDYGSVNVYLDGKLLNNIVLTSSKVIRSEVVFKSEELPRGSHAVYIESMDGALPLDCINIQL